jgi:chromosome segregation ATPase
MIVSYIQNATKYIYPTIQQKISRITPADWKEKTMLMGLVISVCFAVITFFTQAALICGAFVALSGVCGLGALYIRHYENLKKMQEYVKTLQEENLRLSSLNKASEFLVIKQRETTTLLTVENEKLKTEVNKLTVHINFLTQTSQELILSVEDLRIHLATLGPIVTDSQEIQERLKTFSTKMDNQQAVSKYLIELISKAMTEQSDQLALNKEIFHQLKSLQNNDTTFQKIKELNLLQQQLSSIYDKLGASIREHADIQSKTIQTSDKLSVLQKQYSFENTRLQQTRQELSKVSRDLQNTHIALDSLLAKYDYERQNRNDSFT